MWRSGTSLFYALLNQHPQISLLYEDDLLLLWPLFLGGKAKPDWPERWDFWNLGPTRHQMDVHNFPRDVTTIAEACESIWQQYAGLAIGGCKSPNYFDRLPSLAARFPEARFIVIWRNPVDVCRSVLRASQGDSFFAKPGMVLRAIRGCHEMKVGCDALRAKGVPIHEVQYETLVKEPSEVMAGVCRFLDLQYDARMTGLRGADRSAIYDAAHHELVRSERIAGKNEKPEVLPSRVRGKIARYIAFWHERYGGNWPAVPESNGARSKPWFVLERILDGVLYRGLRIADEMIVFLYCFAPLAALRKYRELRGRGETIVIERESLVGASQKD
jgi:hypothetical protein